MKDDVSLLAISFLVSLMASLLILFVSRASASEEITIEGTIQGYQCVATADTCSEGNENPEIEADPVFALFTMQSDVYLMPNIDRDTLMSHRNKILRITGAIHTKDNSVNASKVEVLKDGSWVSILAPVQD